MTTLIDLENVSFHYPGGHEEALKNVSLAVRSGEAVLVTGPTGCGKSTLLKTLNGIIPLESSGRMSGQVLVAGKSTAGRSVAELSGLVGLVFQSPDDQLFCHLVRDEAAFGPENLGLPRAEVEGRAGEALGQVGLAHLAGAAINTLSGGQKQRLAIAGQLAMRPQALALDEPISQLDPQGAAEVLECLKNLKAQGLAVILAEHRLAEVLDLVDRVVVLEAGQKVLDTPKADLPKEITTFQRLGLRLPDELILRRGLGLAAGDDLLAAVRALAGRAGPMGLDQTGSHRPVLGLEGVTYSYPRSGRAALTDISLEVREGEVLAVMGQNGSGKSTLLHLMAGLNRPSAGRLSWQGRRVGPREWKEASRQVGLLFQNPDLLLIEESAAAELASGPRHLRLPGPEIEARVKTLAQALDLTAHLAAPPWALSKGQRLRLALGAIMAMDPTLLLLDEPTTGQNQENIRRLLSTIQPDGRRQALVFCSHDLDTVGRFAHRLALIKDGRLLALAPVREVLGRPELVSQAGLKTPLCLRLSQAAGINPPALTPEELLERLRP